MSEPLGIDIFCGLGGWTDGLLAEGFHVIGFDNERHVYGEHRYPAQLVLQDVRTLHGSQFKDAALIVASPPCQFFSYVAMPWTRGKQLARDVQADPERLRQATELFDACFRIQREACEAAGRHVPMVVENVCGAQKWVGRAKWHYGSYYLWGDVPALMPFTGTRRMKASISCAARRFDERVAATPEEAHALHFRLPPRDGLKVGGLDWNKRIPGQSFNGHAERATKNDGGSCRKAASARIAKIPFELARHIARVYKPAAECAA